jgi:NAD(P)-dependent dehydrogenase (short-subunit alcohol dehydrogenase family)
MILKKRVAIVTGAGSGIGQAGALIMAKEGAHVIVADIGSINAGETVSRILAAGGSAESLVLDVTDDDALEAGIAAVVNRHGRIDILHNHAGAQVAGDLEQVSIEGFDKSWLRGSSCQS